MVANVMPADTRTLLQYPLDACTTLDHASVVIDTSNHRIAVIPLSYAMHSLIVRFPSLRSCPVENPLFWGLLLASR